MRFLFRLIELTTKFKINPIRRLVGELTNEMTLILLTIMCSFVLLVQIVLLYFLIHVFMKFLPNIQENACRLILVIILTLPGAIIFGGHRGVSAIPLCSIFLIPIDLFVPISDSHIEYISGILRSSLSSEYSKYAVLLLLSWFSVLAIVEKVYKILIVKKKIFKINYYMVFWLFVTAIFLIILYKERMEFVFPFIALSIFVGIPNRSIKVGILIYFVISWLVMIILSNFILPFAFVVTYGPNYVGFPVLHLLNDYIRSIPIAEKIIWFASPIINCVIYFMISELVIFIKNWLLSCLSKTTKSGGSKFFIRRKKGCP